MQRISDFIYKYIYRFRGGMQGYQILFITIYTGSGGGMPAISDLQLYRFRGRYVGDISFIYNHKYRFWGRYVGDIRFYLQLCVYTGSGVGKQGI